MKSQFHVPQYIIYISKARGGRKLTDPGAALLRPFIPPAEANIRFNLSIMGEAYCDLLEGVCEESKNLWNFKSLPQDGKMAALMFMKLPSRQARVRQLQSRRG